MLSFQVEVNFANAKETAWHLSCSQRTTSIYKNDLTLTTKIASILSNGSSSPGARRCSSPLTASHSASRLWWWHQRIFKPVFPQLWKNLRNMKPQRIEYFAIKKSHDWICFAVCLFYKHPFWVHGEIGPPVNAAIPQIATRKKTKNWKWDWALLYIVLNYIHGGNMLYTHSHREKKWALYNVIYITAAGTNLSVLHLHLI